MEQNFSSKMAVIDFDIPSLLENKLFIPAEAYKVSHTLLPICYLHDQAKKLGIEMVTPDVFLNMSSKPQNALLVTHLESPYTQKVIAAGAKPIILLCLESSFIATRFYARLKKISAQYKHSIVFSGMKKQLSPKTIYHPSYFPETFNRKDFLVIPFTQKKFLTMISGNKRIGNWKKNLLIKFMYGLGIKEIYEERQKIINFLADRGGFDLYGVGWNKGGKTQGDTDNIKKVYRGMVDSKLETLRQYKFALCFENSNFPGFFTEKVFDCFFAGCVPVYNGAPDAKSLVPPNTFIDVHDFKGTSELISFLENMTEAVYNSYIENIKKFLDSPEFYKFTQESFAENILGLLQKEFQNA